MTKTSTSVSYLATLGQISSTPVYLLPHISTAPGGEGETEGGLEVGAKSLENFFTLSSLPPSLRVDLPAVHCCCCCSLGRWGGGVEGGGVNHSVISALTGGNVVALSTRISQVPSCHTNIYYSQAIYRVHTPPSGWQ